MFWRFTHTSSRSGAVHRALDQVRALLLLDPPPYDWATDLDWPPYVPAESRALQSPVPFTGHRPQPLRSTSSRWRAGAVLERPQECLCPIGHRPPQVRSRPLSRELDKHVARSLRLGG
jgi:hypothetical protein